jgi:hypothetical protein
MGASRLHSTKERTGSGSRRGGGEVASSARERTSCGGGSLGKEQLRGAPLMGRKRKRRGSCGARRRTTRLGVRRRGSMVRGGGDPWRARRRPRWRRVRSLVSRIRMGARDSAAWPTWRPHGRERRTSSCRCSPSVRSPAVRYIYGWFHTESRLRTDVESSS